MSTNERDYKMAAGMIDLVIGSDYASWLPRHICDSWNPDDNYRLMESRFVPRHLVINIRDRRMDETVAPIYRVHQEYERCQDAEDAE